MFRMCPTKKGKTGRTPPLLFPNHLLRLVDNFDQISMSYFRAHNIVTYERNGGGGNEGERKKTLYDRRKDQHITFLLQYILQWC